MYAVFVDILFKYVKNVDNVTTSQKYAKFILFLFCKKFTLRIGFFDCLAAWDYSIGKQHSM